MLWPRSTTTVMYYLNLMGRRTITTLNNFTYLKPFSVVFFKVKPERKRSKRTQAVLYNAVNNGALKSAIITPHSWK